MKTIPNFLTGLRIIAIPVLVCVFYLPIQANHLMASIIFTLAAITDWLDGYLARYWHQTSAFGKFLDPVADKLIVATALVLVVGEHQLPYLTIPAAIIVGREIIVSALREWMAEIGKRASVAVSYIAKFKTAVQMLALIVLLFYKPGITAHWFIGLIGYILLYIAAGLTLWSMLIYVKTAWPDLTFQ